MTSHGPAAKHFGESQQELAYDSPLTRLLFPTTWKQVFGGFSTIFMALPPERSKLRFQGILQGLGQFRFLFLHILVLHNWYLHDPED